MYFNLIFFFLQISLNKIHEALKQYLSISYSRLLFLILLLLISASSFMYSSGVKLKVSPTVVLTTQYPPKKDADITWNGFRLRLSFISIIIFSSGF